ncbi:MAG TPA: hypothetical protein VH105_09520 [Burkholderiales bacterium]|jgi:hypothetical protein|nr:hypothetical protein [Burkholderiales bacterium]
MIEIDHEVSRRITKFSLIGFAILFFLSPVQPLLCTTLMGLAAIVPILLGPNPLRILGLLAFAVAGYMFWPEYQESKKVPTRNAVRLVLERAQKMQDPVTQFVKANRRLPAQGALDLKSDREIVGDGQADYEILPGGAVAVHLKFAPLTGLSVRWEPRLSGGVPAQAPASQPVAPLGAAEAPPNVSPAAQPPQAAKARPAPQLRLAWVCISDDIAQSYLPKECRNSENLRKAQQLQK